MAGSDLMTMDDGCRIAFARSGTAGGPPLVLLHSLGVAHAMWQPQIEALADHFDIIAMDLRGHGASDAGPGPASMDRLGRDVLGLLDGLGLERVAFCGLSIGGMVGQWLGYRAPERLSRLAIANTAPFMGPPSAWQERIATVSASGIAPLIPAILERWFTSPFRAARPDVVAQVQRMLEATAPAGYAACCAAIRDMDLRATAPLIAVPTLVIGGTLDPATNAATARALAEAIPGAALELLPAAHLSNLEAEAAFTAALGAFLLAA